MLAGPHAISRLEERYGLKARDHDWVQAMLDITDTIMGTPRALLLSRRHEVEHWSVRLQGTMVNLVWLPERAFIPTVLPADYRIMVQRNPIKQQRVGKRMRAPAIGEWDE